MRYLDVMRMHRPTLRCFLPFCSNCSGERDCAGSFPRFAYRCVEPRLAEERQREGSGKRYTGRSGTVCLAIRRLTWQIPNFFPELLTYCRVPIADDGAEELSYDFPHVILSQCCASPHFDAAFAFIEQYTAKNEAVLVHCAEGRSRSPSIVRNAERDNILIPFWLGDGLSYFEARTFA